MGGAPERKDVRVREAGALRQRVRGVAGGLGWVLQGRALRMLRWRLSRSGAVGGSASREDGRAAPGCVEAAEGSGGVGEGGRGCGRVQANGGGKVLSLGPVTGAGLRAPRLAGTLRRGDAARVGEVPLLVLAGGFGETIGELPAGPALGYQLRGSDFRSRLCYPPSLPPSLTLLGGDHIHSAGLSFLLFQANANLRDVAGILTSWKLGVCS